MSLNTKIEGLKVKHIHSEARKNINKVIEKINNKADKLGVLRPEVILGEDYTKEFTQYIKADEGTYERRIILELFDIEINISQSMKIEGWNIIAFIDHKSGVHLQTDIDADYDIVLVL